MGESANSVPHRRESDNGLLAGLPIYARVIAIIGIPGAISFILMYILFVMLGVQQKGIDTAILQLNNTLEFLKKLDEKQEAIYRMQQRICARVSKDDAERNGCFDR